MSTKQFFVWKDEDFGIYAVQDHYMSALIQVVKFIRQSKQSADGTVVDLGRQPQLIHQYRVNATENPADIQATMVDGEKFKKEFAANLKIARTLVDRLKKQEDLIKGALTDYEPASKQYN